MQCPPFDPLSLLPGLLSLVPLSSIAERTAQRGVLAMDALALAPGLHLQSTANELHKAEYPACAALTTGYVFRVENPATVFFLQKVARTGCLTNLKVAHSDASAYVTRFYYYATYCTIFCLLRLFIVDDNWGLVFTCSLIAIRMIQYKILERRTQPGWFGAPEPGVQGDLFILLSQDRWVRIRGAVDDLKAVTSGTWLSDKTTTETFFGAVTKLWMYANVAFAGKATRQGTVVITIALLISGAIVAYDNLNIPGLMMYGRLMEVVGEPKKYSRRRVLADELIEESGRDDWAVAMGLIVKDKASAEKNEGIPVTM